MYLYARVCVLYFYKNSSPVFMHRKFNKIQRKIATTERTRNRKKHEHKIKETAEQKRKNNKIKSNRRKWVVEKTTRTNKNTHILHVICGFCTRFQRCLYMCRVCLCSFCGVIVVVVTRFKTIFFCLLALPP